MSEKVLITKSSMDNIGDAIRDRNGLLTKYLPSEMPTAIESIPNNYTLADEGKVVSNGALIAQSARLTEITENGTYDTTENNSVTVNVSGGGSNAHRYGYKDVTFKNTTTDSNIGDVTSDHITTALLSSAGAISGTEQIIYTNSSIDLTDIDLLICKIYSSSFNSNTSGGKYFGVSQTVPESYDDSRQVQNKLSINGNFTNQLFALDVTNLSGQYYIFYSSKIAFSNSGYSESNFEFYTIAL